MSKPGGSACSSPAQGAGVALESSGGSRRSLDRGYDGVGTQVEVVLRTLLVVSALASSTLGCWQSSREVVVTREQVGRAWPLVVNSAVVICSEADGTVLKLGSRRYALDPAARAKGLPDAAEVARQVPDSARGTRPADLEPLRDACGPAHVAER